MNLTSNDIAVLLGALAIAQWITSLWLKFKLQQSVRHEYEKSLDSLRRQRELRLTLLIKAFRLLCQRSCLKTTINRELAESIEDALRDIQLLGTRKQIEAARRFAQSEAAQQDSDLEDILNDFRSEVRSELGLEQIDGPVWQFSYHRETAEDAENTQHVA